MLWTNGEAETSGVAVIEDPAVEPVLATLDGDAAGGEETKGTDNNRSPWPWLDRTEAGPVVVLDARDPEEEDEEDEDEEDSDFFDDEEDEDEDLDDDLEDEDLEDEDFEEDEDEEEEEEDEDF
jgi:hypothetical protein